MKIKKIKFLLIILIFNTSLSNLISQNLKGKWIFLKDSISDTYPSIHILEFNTFRVVQYDFNKPLDSAAYFINNKTINIEGIIKRIEFNNEHVLKITGKSTYNGRDTLLTKNLLRLEKTKTHLSKKQIMSMSYILNWGNTRNKIVFNDSLKINSFKLSRFKFCNDIRLEEIDSTLFITIFYRNKREFVFPIREADETHLLLQNFDLKEIKAKRVMK